MSNVIDYQDRLADILGFQSFFPYQLGREQLLVQELVQGNNGGSLIAGIEKLVQKVLVTLLTPAGSKTHRPQDGTEFIIDARQGLWRTTADVEQSFYSARVDVQRQIVGDETEDDPADEKYADMVLTNVTLVGDKVTIRVAIASQAGSTYVVITPIQVMLH